MLRSIALVLASTALTNFAAVGAEKNQEKAAPPNDAQIAKIVLVADSGDVDYGQLALK
jgi:hypothetical protein